MIREINILRSHGIQYVPDLKKVELTPLFRGRPVISDNISDEEASILVKLCPVGAIPVDDFGIDLGKCVFCKECAFACPEKISFTNDYKIAVNDRESLIIRSDVKSVDIKDALVRKEVRKLFRNSLKLRQVSAGGDNSCEMELNAAGNVNFDMGRFGIEFVASPRHADGIVITGPITENMADALQICYDAVPHPKIIILVGTDAISGGIFSESKAIQRQFLERYPIDLYVPGNPAHPLTFINGILRLLGI
jgi:Ni,Fe-hydrogenase III small subunit/NAD-dependent dihydropyrimidine dehydrogenase PreA subunit